jgi:uncharacterized membrane protein YdfJ with MMPL/SSD domain
MTLGPFSLVCFVVSLALQADTLLTLLFRAFWWPSAGL